MSNSGKGKSFAVGAVVGGVLGAVTALLLAPKSGRELRKDIADTYETAAEKTAEIAGAVTGKTKEVAKAICRKTSDIYGSTVELAGVVAGEVKAWRSARRDLPEAEASIEAVQVTGSANVEQSAEAEAEAVAIK